MNSCLFTCPVLDYIRIKYIVTLRKLKEWRDFRLQRCSFGTELKVPGHHLKRHRGGCVENLVA